MLDKFEDYVLESFNNSNKSLGVLYLGLKGSGKTKRAHKLALDSGLPILYIQDLNIINKPAWKDVIGTDIFNNFVIFIDEYEKKLEDETSVALLEWLDGSTNNKQLFILIGNEKANNKFSNTNVEELINMLNIEFNMYDEFYICDEHNNQVEDDCDTYSISVKKDKVLFKSTDVYSLFNNIFINKLALTNDDINKAEDVYFNLAYTDLNVKIINKNKLSINVNYNYISLATNEKLTSKESITLYMLKETLYYSLSNINNKFLSFGHAL